MTVLEFQQYKKDRKKLAVVTAYDALFARIVEEAGIRVILVGDSLGMVVQGNPIRLRSRWMTCCITPGWSPAWCSELW